KLARSMRYMSVSNPWNGELLIGMEENLARGRRPQVFPILVQGPLMLDFSRRKRRIFPALENSELSGANPPALQRLHLWQRAAITVQGCLEWLFVKLHCHGMDPRSTPALLGSTYAEFFAQSGGRWTWWWVSDTLRDRPRDDQ